MLKRKQNINPSSPQNASLKNKLKSKNKRKSSLKTRLRKKKKQKVKPVALAFTAGIMVISLFIASLSYLVAPSYTLRAQITTVRGGYDLVYDLSELNADKFDKLPDVGDIVFITDKGVITNSPRNSLRLKITSVSDEVVKLAFVPSGIPYHLSTDEMKFLSETAPYGMVFSHIEVTGKMLLNKFIVTKIRFA